MKYPYRNPVTGKFDTAIVRNLPPAGKIVLVDRDYEIDELNNDLNTEYYGFFVVVGDGELTAIWGMYNRIAWLTEPLYRIK